MILGGAGRMSRFKLRAGGKGDPIQDVATLSERATRLLSTVVVGLSIAPDYVFGILDSQCFIEEV